MAKTYLVVGAAPHEDRRGRTFYDHPSVFLLDRRPREFYYAGEVPKGDDFSRYIVLNFMDLAAMALFSSDHINRFDMILFDEAVVKFFEGDLSPLPFFWKMLKPGGQLIMDANVYSGLPWEKYWNGHPKAPYPANFNAQLREQIPNIIIKMQAFVLTELSKLPTISGIESTTYGAILDRDSILKNVYSLVNPRDHVFVVHKEPESVELGGGYRKRRYRKKSRGRKTKRKHRR